MKTKRFLALMLVMLMAFSAYAQDILNNPNPVKPPAMQAPLTGFVTTLDNENNAGTGVADGDMDVFMSNNLSNHPIEFNIFVTDPVVTSAQLSIYALDVDWGPGAEADEVFINNHSLGYLTGTNDTWSTSVFTVNPLWVNDINTNGGKNVIRIMVDQNNAPPKSPVWVVEIDWGQLITNNSTGSATFRYVNLDKSQYCGGNCVKATEEIDANPSLAVDVETYLLDPANNALIQVNRSLTATSGDEPFTETLCIPSNPTAGTWKIEAICYDAATHTQQDIKIVTFTVTNPCNPTVPTLSEWGLIILGFVLLVFGTIFILRWRGTSA